MRKKATAREFVKAWQESETVAEVARKVGSKRNACRVRAFRYRKMGVALKVHEYVESSNIDWDDLRKYAARFKVHGAGVVMGDV
jgi:hypothetical protein